MVWAKIEDLKPLTRNAEHYLKAMCNATELQVGRNISNHKMHDTNASTITFKAIVWFCSVGPRAVLVDLELSDLIAYYVYDTTICYEMRNYHHALAYFYYYYHALLPLLAM